MKIVIILAVIATLIFLAIRKSKPLDTGAEACAKDVINLLRKRPDANAEEIVEIYKSHQRTLDNISNVTVLIKPKLVQAGIKKDRQALVMLEIRRAKELLGE